MFTQLFWNCWVFTCFLDYFIFFSFSSFLELLSISLSYFFRSKKMRSICVFLATVVTSVFCLYLTAKYIYSVDLGLQRNSIKLDQPVSSNISQTGMQSNLCERPPLNNDHLSGTARLNMARLFIIPILFENPIKISHLSTTATFFRSQGWLL